MKRLLVCFSGGIQECLCRSMLCVPSACQQGDVVWRWMHRVILHCFLPPALYLEVLLVVVLLVLVVEGLLCVGTEHASHP